MTVEIIAVGTEILLGNIVNTNAAYLAEKCASLGLSCYHQDVVGDNEERLADTLKLALSRADIILLSGGLGPTQDDLTKEVAAKVCGRQLYLHEPSKEAIRQFLHREIWRLQRITGNRPWCRRDVLLWRIRVALRRGLSLRRTVSMWC